MPGDINGSGAWYCIPYSVFSAKMYSRNCEPRTQFQRAVCCWRPVVAEKVCFQAMLITIQMPLGNPLWEAWKWARCSYVHKLKRNWCYVSTHARMESRRFYTWLVKEVRIRLVCVPSHLCSTAHGASIFIIRHQMNQLYYLWFFSYKGERLALHRTVWSPLRAV